MKFKEFLILLFIVTLCRSEKPNVVIIVADDLGYHDLSFRGSDEIPTPNIDALAYNGAILNRFYTPPTCTPSRSSFMTGKYPFRLGMQHYVVPADEPWGLGLDQKVFPQYFKEAGYKTKMIGKWHLGFYQQQYTPYRRGFDDFFGYLGSHLDYFDFTLKSGNFSVGYDLRRKLEVVDKSEIKYATELFTEEAVRTIKDHDKNNPLFLLINHLAPHAGNEDDVVQAPQAEIDKFSHIQDKKRRTLAAMISILDRSVGVVMKSLKANGMLENSVILFYSDNGGPSTGNHATHASNHPLRGQKVSPWEGGIRTNAIVYAPFIKNPGHRNQLFHISDLLPTLGGLAGIQITEPLDGIDQWSVIDEGFHHNRFEVVDFDDISGYGAYIARPFKIVNGSMFDGAYDHWLGAEGTNNNDPVGYARSVLDSDVAEAISSLPNSNELTVDQITYLREESKLDCGRTNQEKPCKPLESPCVFNIISDPCEKNNLADNKPLLNLMNERFNQKIRQAVPSRRQPSDPRCDPSNFNMNWQWWQEDS